MKRIKMFIIGFLDLFLALAMMTSVGWAQKYELGFDELRKFKGPVDDPSPIYKKLEGYKKIIPPDVYKKVTYDVEAMKKTWAETVGFRAPDVVGKVAPEIKPGKYTYKDKAKFPFEKLMWKHMYDRFNPPPTSGLAMLVILLR